MKIFIADDHPRVRESIRSILEKEYKEATFGEASNGEDAYKEIKNGSWDLVIADISMPRETGVQLAQKMKNEKIITPIVLISLENGELYKKKALSAGASALVDKSLAYDNLLSEIKKILIED